MKVAYSPLLIATLVFAGCSIGPDYTPPKIDAGTAFDQAKGKKFSSEKPLTSWWESFGDPQLTKLIQEAVTSNKDIRRALARINESRALRRQAELDLYPTWDSDVQYTLEKASEARMFGAPPELRGKEIKILRTGLDAVWELDLFGRIGRSIEAAEADEDASIAGLDDGLRILASEIARTYFELRGAQAQLKVARDNAKNQKETLRLTEVLVKGGQSSELDTTRARAQHKTTLATIPPLVAAKKAAVHRLSVLLGKNPATLKKELYPHAPLPRYNGPVGLGNPEELLTRRPDVRSAEKQLHSATANVGVAIGEYFPRVTFNGTLGLEAGRLGNLGRSGSEAYVVGPSISWVGLNYGGVRARVRAAGARAEQALAAYEQTVLMALEETENSLARFSSERRRRDLLREATEESRKAASLARLRYQDGLADLLTVLDAQRTVLQAERELTQSETDLSVALVGIYKALGGGWEDTAIRARGKAS